MTTKTAQIESEVPLRRTIRENMRARRLELGLRQADVAQIVGVSQPYLARLENPNRTDQPTFEVLEGIAKALRTTVAALTNEGTFSTFTEAEE
jgi:transcriptional regulator with XRE-family HTH domain